MKVLDFKHQINFSTSVGTVCTLSISFLAFILAVMDLLHNLDSLRLHAVLTDRQKLSVEHVSMLLCIGLLIAGDH